MAGKCKLLLGRRATGGNKKRIPKFDRTLDKLKKVV
jgi:hypothetical protein